MALFSRNGGRKSSSYCSSITLVVFVAFCLIGVWTYMSSSIVPVQSSDLSSSETNDEVEAKVAENYSRQFEDGPGDLPESNNGNRDTSVKDNTEENHESENTVGENQEETKGDGNNSVDQEDIKSNAQDDQEEKSDKKFEPQEEPKAVDDGETENGGGKKNVNDQTDENLSENKLDSTEQYQEDKLASDNEEDKGEQSQDKDSEENSGDNNTENKKKNEIFPSGANSEILNETTTQNGAWSTQAVESQNMKDSDRPTLSKDQNGYKWKLCNSTAGPDYIPCLDDWESIKALPGRHHYEHRERHCPKEAPTCLVPLPEGYRTSIKWPKSRDKIWYFNVPHTKLAEVKGHQNWVKVTGDFLTFPGGGTQFKHGALHYIDFIQDSLPDIAWGKRSRVILDVGCGVASFGGYLFERDVLAMSFAPKDEHEAQVQFALERGIPAISAVMGTMRLPYPANVFDLVHCARCRVPWHIEGGKLLLELNRVLRPGGYFVWSATPVYQHLPEDVGIWKEMTKLTKAMCWDLVVIKKDKLNDVADAIYRKPTSNKCYEERQKQEPPLCEKSDDPNAAWNVPLQACLHKVPVKASERGSKWPEQWPLRLEKPPYWLKSEVGVYGKAGPEDFTADYDHWKNVVSQSYLNGMGINWSSVRNVMDMRAIYGGFAAALKDMKIWVMNIVPVDSADTLPIIYERGLFGIYHDWCQSFSTYPRTYDLLHADHLFFVLKKRCNLVAVIAEVDRVLRPNGKLIVRDNVEIISEVENMAKSLKWEIRFIYSKDNEGLLCVQKKLWRPTQTQTIMSAIA